MSTVLKKLWAVVRAFFLSFLILIVGQVAWGVLLEPNLAKTPAIPWSVPAMAVILWLMWRYLGGKWWPARTSEARRRDLRANRVPGAVYAWSLVAGLSVIIAMAGCWIVMFQLVNMKSIQWVPDFSKYPLTMALAVIMASLVSPFTEEPAFRGYAQVILEREFAGPVAIAISSIYFAVAHLNHGFFWPKLLIYFLVGVAFGTIAFLSRSILPVLPVHIIADLTFFLLVWPHDPARSLIRGTGADIWFWIHVLQAAVFTAVSIPAFVKLAKVCQRSRAAAQWQ
jgi:membrane protease YdiL (CAAX protease family)